MMSGHIMMNGYLELSKIKRGSLGTPISSHASSSRGISGDTKVWKPRRKDVNTEDWTIYDPKRKKMRKVCQEEDSEWWFIEVGGVKTFF